MCSVFSQLFTEKRMKIDIVIGLGFGDEGKGNVVNMFNGGHQAGHHVVMNDGTRHTFSSFGSGTLSGASTYISKYCTLDPLSWRNEFSLFKTVPVYYVDAEVMLVTPYDVRFNKMAWFKEHGTVGVGFGATIRRHEEEFHKIFARDLWYPKILRKKVELIRELYTRHLPEKVLAECDKVLEDWFLAGDELAMAGHIVTDFYEIKYDHRKHLVFEGAQGVMLDMDYGFFPHVTRSNTTTRNVWTLPGIMDADEITTYYVTRAYQTRHGNGPMTNEEWIQNIHIGVNPYEINNDKGMQGEFRRTLLDVSLLQYAYECDRYHNISENAKLVVTCLDHAPMNGEQLYITTGGNLSYLADVDSLPKTLGMRDYVEVIKSHSPNLKESYG